MIIHNMEQQTPEWFACKKGKMSASHAQAIGNAGAGLKTYIHEMMAEYYSTGEKERFGNKHTDRGNEYEFEAAEIYALEKNATIKEIGFAEVNEYLGCSPDRLVNLDGLLEIKCPCDKVYFKELLSGVVSKQYVWQMQMQMLIMEKDWCDYMAYNPNYPEQPFIIKRFHKDPIMQASLKKGIDAGVLMIQNIKSQIESKTI